MKVIARLIKAPFFLAALLASMIPVFFFFAWVSVGAWAEAALRAIGYRERPWWLPAILGFVGYGGFGVALPAYLGARLAGWPGGILLPLMTLGIVAILGRW